MNDNGVALDYYFERHTYNGTPNLNRAESYMEMQSSNKIFYCKSFGRFLQILTR